MESLVIESHRAWQSKGKISYGVTEAEKKSLVFRRSLYIVKDMKKGETLSEKNVRAIRPGLGLPPKYLEVIIGKKVTQNVKVGTPLSWDLVK